MLEIANHTPFSVGIGPNTDKHAQDWASVAVKGTFDIDAGAELPVSLDQLPIWEGDQYWGDPASSSIRYASDLGPAKLGTDVVLLGHAYPERGRLRVRDVALQVGPVRKLVRVFGDRHWIRGALGWAPSDPVEMDRVPLRWERAFGGYDRSGPEVAFEPRNPVGTGFVATGKKERLEGLALPNLEDPSDLISKWRDCPAPAGFGFVGAHWMPRAQLAGTYDETWRTHRLPYLPEDFDERYHNAASPQLVASPHLVGGERVAVVGASANGTLSFSLPRQDLTVSVWIRGQECSLPPLLDTVVIEPDEQRVSLTWRASFPCTRRFLHIEAVVVDFEARP